MGRLIFCALLAALAAACGMQDLAAPLPDPAVVRAARQFAARLDYVAADYANAVAAGRVARAREFEEQLELLDDAIQLGAALSGLDAAAEVAPIIKLVEAKADPAEVAAKASALADRALAVSGVILSPLGDPDFERARALFRENCERCHGKAGAGDGPEAAKLTIKPRSFLDEATMDSMLPRRVFSALADGIAKADMPQFDLLSADDRWSLSFFVMTLRFDGLGKEPALANIDLEVLANRSDRDLRAELGEGQPALIWARSALPFLRTSGPLAAARGALAKAIADHRGGKRAEAEARIDAILADDFSAYRPALTARAPRLSRRIEQRLYTLREAIPTGAAPALEQLAIRINSDLRAASSTIERISPHAMAAVTTLASLGWILVLLFAVSEAARSMRLERADRAIVLGAGVATMTGLATLLAISDPELNSASSRHQVVALFGLISAIGALACVLIVVRRLAVPVEKLAPSQAPMPWWLAGGALACVHGGVLDWSHRLGGLADETDSSIVMLGLTGVVAIAALVALLRLLVEIARRAGLAANLTAIAVVGIVCAIALVGGAAHQLIDGGSLPAIQAGSFRADLLSVYPQRWVAVPQIVVASAGAAIAVWALVSARPRRG